MLLFLIPHVLAQDSRVCNVENPVSVEQLRIILDSCIVPIGTHITIHIEGVSSQDPIPGIGFKPGDATLNQNGKDTLDGIVVVLAARKKLKIKIVGYADPGEKGNLAELSLRRAEAAASYIVSKGVDPAVILVEAGTPDNRIDYTDTQEGRARNRRLEFIISAPNSVK